MAEWTPPGLVQWLAGGARGVSSNTIVQHLTGWPALRDWRPDVPHDPDDLDRCLKLLRDVPALRPLIPKTMAAEIMFENDEYSGYWQSETPEHRWSRMRQWIASLIVVGKEG